MATTKIKKIVTYTATRDGVQASASTEKKAVELLEKTIKERDRKAEYDKVLENERDAPRSIGK